MKILPSKPLNSKSRMLWLVFCGVILAAVLSAAITIPFLFESFSIKYKFGFHKLLLRSGKVVGIIAAVILVVQLVLVSRMGWVNRLAGMDRLVQLHRKNGIFIATLALIHPLFVFGPEDIATIPISMEFWPEVVGGMLLIAIFYMTSGALFKTTLGFPFHLWMNAHRVGGFLVLAGLFVHLFFSSETFEEGIPLWAGAAVALLCAGVYLFRYVRPLRPLSTWRVSGVTPAGDRAIQIRISPEEPGPFAHFPGQFAFLSFPDGAISPEPHPFTIASSPSAGEEVEFFIGTGGDWTRTLHKVRPGDAVTIDGPFGAFSHLNTEKGTPLLFVAGGVGITPMLSMIRYISETGDPRPVRLIWSNRSRNSIFCHEELFHMQETMPDFCVSLIYSDEPGGRRLDRETLKETLSTLDNPDIFLCGPPPMMMAISPMLQELGVSKRKIHTEVFGF